MVTNSKNQALVEGAFFAALTVVLGLMGLYIPPLLFVTTLLMPLPLAVLVRRRDLRLGLMSLLVASALMFILFGRPITVFLLILQSGPLGILLGLLFKNRVSAGPGIIACSVVAAAMTVLTLLISFWITGINPFAVGEEMRRSMEQVVEWYRRAGWVDESALRELEAGTRQMTRLVALLLPANLVIWSVISAYITYALTRLVFIRINYEVTPLPPFSRWKFPWYIIWGGITGLALTLLGDEFAIPGLGAVGKNILYIVGFLHFILGISVATYFVKNWKIARVLKYLIVGLVALYWPFALSVLLTLGIMDPILNVRRLPADGETTRGGK